MFEYGVPYALDLRHVELGPSRPIAINRAKKLRQVRSERTVIIEPAQLRAEMQILVRKFRAVPAAIGNVSQSTNPILYCCICGIPVVRGEYLWHHAEQFVIPVMLAGGYRWMVVLHKAPDFAEHFQILCLGWLQAAELDF